MEEKWDIAGCLSFIQSRMCKIVALQFPDELLKDAPLVVAELSRRCNDASLDTRVSFPFEALVGEAESNDCEL